MQLKLVIVLTRAAPALQYHFLFFFWVGLVVYSCVVMTICGKNVDTLRPCKRSNRDFFWLRSTENTYILSSPVFLYTRTNLVSKTPILKVLARVSFYRQPMTICGKNVDTLRPCKRSNRDFFWLWSTENTHIPSSPVFLYITRGVLMCLLGFLALWGQKPCGGN